MFLILRVLDLDNKVHINFSSVGLLGGWAKGDWDFRVSVLIKNPDGTDI